jgi:putative ABC transport system substrate-binding protein
MDRRAFIGSLAFGLLAPPLAAEGKVPRIAFVVNTPEADMVGPVPRGRNSKAFLEGLRDLGWVDGQNIKIERRSAEGRADRAQPLLQEMVRLQVDLIVTVGSGNIRAAKQATATIPIVMAGTSLPVESGLVKSLARPGANITGLTFEASADLDGKRLEALKETVPKVTRVAVIGRSRRAGRPIWRAETEAAARALGLTLQLVTVDTPEEFEKAFATIARERAHAVFAENSAVNSGRRRLIIDFAARQKLPAVYTNRDFVESGGLMAYGPDSADLFRRAATYVDKILKGAKPADLPVEQPTKFELVVNMRAAKALGLTIPPSLLLRADQVIE